jgi:hypothetical protein
MLFWGKHAIASSTKKLNFLDVAAIPLPKQVPLCICDRLKQHALGTSEVHFFA